jgi:hypothetical protein
VHEKHFREIFIFLRTQHYCRFRLPVNYINMKKKTFDISRAVNSLTLHRWKWNKMYLYYKKNNWCFYRVFLTILLNLFSCHKKKSCFGNIRQVEGQCHEIFSPVFSSTICEWFSGEAMQLKNVSAPNVNVIQRLSAIRPKCRKKPW